MDVEIVFDREEDGRWIAEVESLPGVLVYGATKSEARLKVKALALRVIADRIEVEQRAPDSVRFAAA
jgi:predicted RNase H-like HicB family nuclease